MTTPTAVSERDLHTLLRVALAPDLGDDGLALPRSTLTGLTSLISCDQIAFDGLDTITHRRYLAQNTWDKQFDPDEQDPVFWRHYWESVCSYPDRTGDWRSVIKISDFYSLREYRRMPTYTDVFRPRNQEHEMLACLPDGPGRSLRLIFFRGIGAPDFTERDRALVTLLRPHLRTAHRDVLRRRRGIPHLTPRQWELLQLIREGYSNAQIARRLVISQHTVRKHIENIFERLNVTSRTAALAHAYPDGASTLD